MTDLFDPAASRAVLLGCSRYPHDEALTPLPAVRANLVVLETILTDPALCGIARDDCDVLTDPSSAREVGLALQQAASAAQDLFLVYYAGHGLIDRSGQLYLAIATTDTTTLNYTAIPFSQVRESIRQSAARNRVLILDCCFSGRAIEAQSDPDSLIRGQMEIEGAYTLTATPRNATALAPAGARLTAFTGELAQVLRGGIQGGEPVLTLDAVYADLHGRLARKGRPQPDVSSTRTSGRLGIVRNSFGVRSADQDVADLILGGASGPYQVMSTVDDTLALMDDFDSPGPRAVDVQQHAPAPSISTLARDVQEVANVLRRTIGPARRSALVRKADGGFLETSEPDDIVKVFSDHAATRPGIGFVVDIAREMQRSCDDGVATAAILGAELVQGLADELAAGVSSIELGRALRQLHDRSVLTLESLVAPVQDGRRLVAAIGAQGIDPELSEVLAGVLAPTEKWFEILVEPSEGDGIELAAAPAVRVDAGFCSPYFVTDPQGSSAELEEPFALVLGAEPQLATMLPVLEKVMPTGRPVAIFAPDVTGELLNTLIVNKLRTNLRSVAVGVGAAGQPEAVLRAIAAATGATVLESADALTGATLGELGQLRRLVATKDSATLLVTEVRAQDIIAANPRMEAGRVAVLRVGAPTSSAQPLRIEETKKAVRIAQRLLDGVVPGGGGAYLRAADRLELNHSGATLLPVVVRALRAPARQIAVNAGRPANGPEQLLHQAAPTAAYDALTDSVVDMWSHPLLDSALTVRRAWDLAFDLANRYLQLS